MVLYEKLRQHVLRRDGWRCQCCGTRSNLEVHHKEFRSQGGDDSEQNLITLCVGCHSLTHRCSCPTPTRQSPDWTGFSGPASHNYNPQCKSLSLRKAHRLWNNNGSLFSKAASEAEKAEYCTPLLHNL